MQFTRKTPHGPTARTCIGFGGVDFQSMPIGVLLIFLVMHLGFAVISCSLRIQRKYYSVALATIVIILILYKNDL